MTRISHVDQTREIDPKSFIELIQDQNYFPKEAEGDVDQTREILFKHKLQTYLTLGLDQNEHKVLNETLIKKNFSRLMRVHTLTIKYFFHCNFLINFLIHLCLTINFVLLFDNPPKSAKRFNELC